MLWGVCGFGGYKVGDMIATKINPDYVNYLDAIIDLLAKDNGANAFTWYSFVIAFVFIVVGFLTYSVLAGLVAATISRLEDLSTGMALFQVPVIIGWLGAYLTPMFNNKLVDAIVNYLPISSPFAVPGNIILGKFSVMESMISLLVLSLTCVGLILYTGKVYKGKLFNRK
jgi:ABC-type Na+ efflux pump permease subunit